MLDGLRLSLGTLTLLPVGMPAVIDRRVWGRAMLLAPLVGAVVGCLASVLSVVVTAGGSALLGATAAVAAIALLTRGLHLDGLADVADALGSRKGPDEARAVMRRSDVGPFGVVSLVLLLLTQVASLATLLDDDATSAVVTVIAASVVSRAAMTWACRAGVAAADPTGLGAAVAGTVPRLAGATVVAATVAVVVAVAAGFDAAGALRYGVVAAGALAVSEAWRRHCSRRLGGVTGDVLGATEQVTWTTFVVALSLT